MVSISSVVDWTEEYNARLCFTTSENADSTFVCRWLIFRGMRPLPGPVLKSTSSLVWRFYALPGPNMTFFVTMDNRVTNLLQELKE